MTEDKNRFWRTIGEWLEGADCLELLLELLGGILRLLFELILELLGGL